MAGTAFVLGGTGQIGRALADRLVETGWQVTVAARGGRPVPEGVRFVPVDRTKAGELEAALGDGVDVLVDLIPLWVDDATQLLSVAGRVGSLVAVSSASVYADADGRSLDEATGADNFPVLPVPIPETQETVEPGEATYSTRKVAIERTLLERSPVPVTVVRPCAIHGPWTTLSREWFFVKRALDGRRVVVLGGHGESVFHTTSVANLAELVRLAAGRPGTRVVNCGDPSAATVLEIARLVGGALGREWVEVLVPYSPYPGPGATPWSVPRSFVLEMSAAEAELDYSPLTTYADAVRETCDWLVNATEGADWRKVLTGSAEVMAGDFDYAAEDALIAGLAG